MDQHFVRGLRGYLREEFIKVLDHKHPVVGQAWYGPTTVGSRGYLVSESLLGFGQHGFGYRGSERQQSFAVGFYSSDMGRSLGWTPDDFAAQMKTKFDTFCDEGRDCGYAGQVITFHEGWFQAGRDAIALASEVMEECLVEKDAQGTARSIRVADMFKVMTLDSRYVHPDMISGPGQVTVYAARENRSETYDLVRDYQGHLCVNAYDVGAGKERYSTVLRDERPRVSPYHISRESSLYSAFRDGVTYAALVLRQEPSKDPRVDDLVSKERSLLVGMTFPEKLAC